MPVKLRTPKARNDLITPEAVALFKRGLELKALGAHDLDDNATGDVKAAQDEYNDIERRLHWTLLGLVGDAGPLDIDIDGDTDGGSPTYRASIPQARKLHKLLTREIRR